MQNKGVIRLFAILLALACVYYFSFTYFSSKTESAAKEYAADYVSQQTIVDSAKKAAIKSGKDSAGKERFYLDSIQLQTADNYLKRVKDSAVYPIFGFTYEQCKEKSINLGLDLK